jgi:hypothetical protein
LLSDVGQQRESFADGGLSFATPAAGTLVSALRPEQLGSQDNREVTFGSNQSVLVPLRISIPEGVTT